MALGILLTVSRAGVAAPPPVAAPSVPPGQTRSGGLGAGLEVPSSCTVTFMDSGPEGEGTVRLSGYVDIQCGDFRIQADTVLYNIKTRNGSAEGVVVLDWGNNRITGSRLEFDLARQTGTMTEATGWIEPEALLEAKTMEKLDEDHVLIESGVFTSCTQPIPYWSFRVGKGLFHLKHYAHLHNVRLNVGRVPVFYLPWMLWPIKQDRAAGLLFPQWGSSRKYGLFFGDAFFWPFATNADVTIIGEYYRFGGPAGGLEANWLPTPRGRARLTGFYLYDTERDERRYASRLQYHDALWGGWRTAADLNTVSDARFYQDFETNLAAASSTIVLSTLNFVRNGDYNSLNVKAQRREQFFFAGDETTAGPNGPEITPILRSTLIQQTLPEVELRGRSRSLPGSPLFFAFESSGDYFLCDTKSQEICTSGERSGICSPDSGNAGADCSTPGLKGICTGSGTCSPKSCTENGDCGSGGRCGTSCRGAGWSRVDVQPVLSVPVSPLPWLSLEGRASLRETYYTAARNPITGVIDDNARVDRSYFELGGEAIGPRFFHVYSSNSSFSPSYKHVIEPRLVYSYIPVIDEQPFVPIIDDRDQVADDSNTVTLQIGNRLFAKRPPRLEPLTETKPRQGSETGGILPWSSFPTPIETPPPPVPVPVSVERPASSGGSSEEEGAESGEAGEGLEESREPPPPGLPGGGGEMSRDVERSPANPGAGTPGQLPGAAPGSQAPSQSGGPAPQPPAAGAAPSQVGAEDQNPVEILNVTLSQPYSFGRPLLCKNGTMPPCPLDIDPATGNLDKGPQYGPMTLTAHFNPTLTLSMDLRTDYNFASGSFTSNAVSGWYRWQAGYLNLNYSRQDPPGLIGAVTNQTRLGSGGILLNHKLTLDGDLGYDLVETKVLDWRARVAYYTQCCGFVVEYLDRRFEENPRREIHFIIDLKGIGKFLDPNLSLAK